MLNLWLSLEGVGEGNMVTSCIGCPGLTRLNRGSWSEGSIIDGLRSVYLQIKILGVAGKGKKLHLFFFYILLSCYGFSISPVDYININYSLVTVICRRVVHLDVEELLAPALFLMA